MFLLKSVFIFTVLISLHVGEAKLSTAKVLSFLSYEVPTMSTAELKNLMTKSSFVILDAREDEEYKVSHISSALFVGYKKFDLAGTLKKIPKNHKVIVYCSVGYRSGKVAEQLRRKGVEAYNLEGGIFKWVNSGNPVFNSKNKKTLKVHGYNSSWSKKIKKGEPVL